MRARARLALPLLAWPAVHAAKPWRIVVVTYRGLTDVERGFAAHFAARGIAAEFTHHDIALDTARLPAVVAEIRRLRPDLVTTWGSGVTLGIAGPWQQPDATRFITDIPIVFSLVAAPVSAGIVPALASSGRNLTGVSHLAPLEAQWRVMAGYRAFRRVGVLYSGNEPNALVVLDELRALGRQRGFEVLAQTFAADAQGKPTAEGAEARLAALKAGGAEWLYLPPDSFLTTQLKARVLPVALQLGLPAFASTEQQVSAGALTGLVSRYFSVGQFAAYKAEQILLQGRLPQSLPVETLARFSLQVQMPVARQLGLLPPLSWFNHAELLEP